MRVPLAFSKFISKWLTLVRLPSANARLAGSRERVKEIRRCALREIVATWQRGIRLMEGVVRDSQIGVGCLD